MTTGCDVAPRVSVIMNAYNSARFLQDSIDSALAQTFEDFEIIFWDGGSTDASAEIARACGDPRMRVFVADVHEPLGPSRNHAVARARGEWLAFLDCDDLWAPEKLQRQLDRLTTAPPDTALVYCRALAFSDRGDEGEAVWQYAGRDLPEGGIHLTLLREGNLVAMLSALVRRDAYLAVGGIPDDYQSAEDYYLFAALSEKYPAVCVQQILCRYRVHPDSITARHRRRSHEEALQVLEHFGGALPAADLAARRRVYHTLIAAERLWSERDWVGGLRQLVARGSLAYLVAGGLRTAWRRGVLGRRPYA